MHRQPLALLAAMALGISVLAAATPAAAVDPPDGATYVALGDSEAAGTGNLPYVDAECTRSSRAYPVQLGAMLAVDTANVSCGGATTHAVAALQVDALGTDTQLVTITAGMNNINWRFILFECRAGGDPVRCAEVKADALTALQQLPVSVAQMLAVVRTHAPNAQIVVTGYPLLFGDLTSGFCSAGAYRGALVRFSAAETQFINGGVQLVNGAIAGGVAAYAGAAGDPGVSFVDVTAHFDGHGLCDTGDRWVSGIVSGNETFSRSFHLNVPGMEQYAVLLAAEIAG